RTAVASKKGPDVVLNYASPAIFDYYRGLLPLTSYITPDQRRHLTGWTLTSTGLSDKGTPYGLPWNAQGVLPYYNKALFRKAGVDDPDGRRDYPLSPDSRRLHGRQGGDDCRTCR